MSWKYAQKRTIGSTSFLKNFAIQTQKIHLVLLSIRRKLAHSLSLSFVHFCKYLMGTLAGYCWCCFLIFPTIFTLNIHGWRWKRCHRDTANIWNVILIIIQHTMRLYSTQYAPYLLGPQVQWPAFYTAPGITIHISIANRYQTHREWNNQNKLRNYVHAFYITLY